MSIWTGLSASGCQLCAKKNVPKSGTMNMIDIFKCFCCIRSYTIFSSSETGRNCKLLYIFPFQCCFFAFAVLMIIPLICPLFLWLLPQGLLQESCASSRLVLLSSPTQLLMLHWWGPLHDSQEWVTLPGSKWHCLEVNSCSLAGVFCFCLCACLFVVILFCLVGLVCFNWFWMQSLARGLRGWFCSF